MTKQERDQYMFDLHNIDVSDLTRSRCIVHSEPEPFILPERNEIWKAYYENQELQRAYFENRKRELEKYYKLPIDKPESKEEFMDRMAEEAGHKQPLYTEEDLVPSDIFSNPKYLKS